MDHNKSLSSYNKADIFVMLMQQILKLGRYTYWNITGHTTSSVLLPTTQVSLPWLFALVIYLISKELQSYVYMHLLNYQQGKALLSDALKLFYHYIMYLKNWLYRGNKFTGKPVVFILTDKVMNPNWPELNQLTLYNHELHV